MGTMRRASDLLLVAAAVCFVIGLVLHTNKPVDQLASPMSTAGCMRNVNVMALPQQRASRRAALGGLGSFAAAGLSRAAFAADEKKAAPAPAPASTASVLSMPGFDASIMNGDFYGQNTQFNDLSKKPRLTSRSSQKGSKSRLEHWLTSRSKLIAAS